MNKNVINANIVIVGNEVIKHLINQVNYHDPYVPRIHNMRKYDLDIESSDLRQELLKDMDAVLLITDHSDYDYEWIVKNSKLVLDTRNATQNVKADRHKIIKAQKIRDMHSFFEEKLVTCPSIFNNQRTQTQ